MVRGPERPPQWRGAVACPARASRLCVKEGGSSTIRSNCWLFPCNWRRRSKTLPASNRQRSPTPLRAALRCATSSTALELSIQHFFLWLAAGLRRIGLPVPIERWARPLDRVASLLDGFGGKHGGMLVSLVGMQTDGTRRRIDWHLTAPARDGPEAASARSCRRPRRPDPSTRERVTSRNASCKCSHFPERSGPRSGSHHMSGGDQKAITNIERRRGFVPTAPNWAFGATVGPSVVRHRGVDLR